MQQERADEILSELDQHDFSRDETETVQIFVRILADKTIAMEVQLSDTIDTVKRHIQDKEGILSIWQRLLFAGRQLEGWRTVAHSNIIQGSTLELLLTLLGGMNDGPEHVETENDPGPDARESHTAGLPWSIQTYVRAGLLSVVRGEDLSQNREVPVVVQNLVRAVGVAARAQSVASQEVVCRALEHSVRISELISGLARMGTRIVPRDYRPSHNALLLASVAARHQAEEEEGAQEADVESEGEETVEVEAEVEPQVEAEVDVDAEVEVDAEKHDAKEAQGADDIGCLQLRHENIVRALSQEFTYDFELDGEGGEDDGDGEQEDEVVVDTETREDIVRKARSGVKTKRESLPPSCVVMFSLCSLCQVPVTTSIVCAKSESFVILRRSNVLESVNKLAPQDRVLSAASAAALKLEMQQMAPRLRDVIHTPTKDAVIAAMEIVATYLSGEVIPTTYVIGDRGVGRELLAKEQTLVNSVLEHWPEYADFIRAGLVNGAEVDCREPTLTVDSLFLHNKTPTFVAAGSYIPVIILEMRTVAVS
jgi:ubiquitin